MIYNAQMPNDKLLPIAVDLDGTLLLTDTLHESCLQLLRSFPIYILLIPFYLFFGKAYLKEWIAKRVTLNPSTLPYNHKLITWLKKQKKIGHRLILCTATNYRFANTAAAYLNLFDEIIASDSQNNLSGSNKEKALIERFGKRKFIYVANSNIDLKVWRSAAQAVVVNANAALLKKVALISKVTKTILPPAITFKTWIQVFRIHQYLKNILLFIPLVAAHQISQIGSLSLLFLAFTSFSFCASSVYITNDLIDLENDRQHPRKRNRAFAAGLIPIKYGITLALISFLTSLILASLIGTQFITWLFAYFIIAISYSIIIKKIVLLDCFTLALLYTLRIIAGASVTSIVLSTWLLAFSIFLFLSLAFVKRYTELKGQILQGKTRAAGRGYQVDDLSIIQTLGIVAGYAATLVLALYLNSETVVSLYANPQLIWMAVPLMVFWVSWMWLKAHRGEMHDDPIEFVIQDKTSLAIGSLLIAIFIVASNWLNT